jgi:ribosomal-protein-alanine N-acetyltransferase
MRAGLIQAINDTFHEQKLHRLEANIQPDNYASIRLVRSLGFQLEGLSPK